MDQARLDELMDIRWLSNCGEPLDFSSSYSIHRVSSWKEAGELSQDPDWEAVLLEERNKLSLYLYHNHFDEFQTRWNPAAGLGRAHFDNYLKPIIAAELSKMPLEESSRNEIVISLRSAVIGAVVRQEFTDCKPALNFYPELLRILRCGHLPCGWILPWPDGKLAVY